jgi:ribosomal protein S13
MGKFTRLNVGDFKMDSLTTDQLEDLVDELTAAQERGDLNLETEQGLTRLQEIVESYL